MKIADGRWIRLGGGVEIYRFPVFEDAFVVSNPMPFPIRGVSWVQARAHAKSLGYRLPTEEEWLEGWGRMVHFGLWEWTSTKWEENKERYVLRGGSWDGLPLPSARCIPLSPERCSLFPGTLYDKATFRCARDPES